MAPRNRLWGPLRYNAVGSIPAASAMNAFAPLLALLTLGAIGAPAAPTTRPQTGQFQISFTDRSPDSAPERLARRAGWSLAKLKKEGAEIEYDLPKESFEIYIPDSYDGSMPYGLLVWISPSPSGKPMGQYREVLNRHRLIYIGANNSGNQRLVLARLGLAIDAAFNVTRRYAIDPDRVYVTGVSGGGRCASILGVIAPDIFRGGMYMIGSDFYRPLPGDAAVSRVRRFREGFAVRCTRRQAASDRQTVSVEPPSRRCAREAQADYPGLPGDDGGCGGRQAPERDGTRIVTEEAQVLE